MECKQEKLWILWDEMRIRKIPYLSYHSYLLYINHPLRLILCGEIQSVDGSEM